MTIGFAFNGRKEKLVPDFRDIAAIVDILHFSHADVRGIELSGSIIDKTGQGDDLVIILHVAPELQEQFVTQLQQRVAHFTAPTREAFQRARLDTVIDVLRLRSTTVCRDLEHATSHLLGNWRQMFDVFMFSRRWRTELKQLEQLPWGEDPLFLRVLANDAREYERNAAHVIG
jgi:hypothetical protein